MSNYTKSTNFASKDALTSGNALKIVKGTEIDTEFNNIATAIATKADTGGTTAVASGGTGATTAAGARANLLPTFASNIGKVLAVNSSATDVEFVAAGGTGTVTSVSGSGGSTGLTLTGGAITTSGTLTLGGTLAVASGGTGSSSLSGAGIVTTTGSQSISGTKTFTSDTNFQALANFITPTGGASFGQATPNGNYAIYCQPNATSGIGGLATQGTSVYIGHVALTQFTSIPMIGFFYGTPASGVGVGSVVTNGTSTSYVTTSDYRLKENIVPLANAVTRIKQLAPKNFTWKSAPEKGAVEGFIAHELQAVVPDAVFGEKDAIDQDGNPKHQGVDSSFLVPLLTSALQEAIAKIEALEVRITALESQ